MNEQRDKAYSPPMFRSCRALGSTDKIKNDGVLLAPSTHPDFGCSLWEKRQ